MVATRVRRFLSVYKLQSVDGPQLSMKVPRQCIYLETLFNVFLKKLTPFRAGFWHAGIALGWAVTAFWPEAWNWGLPVLLTVSTSLLIGFDPYRVVKKDFLLRLSLV